MDTKKAQEIVANILREAFREKIVASWNKASVKGDGMETKYIIPKFTKVFVWPKEGIKIPDHAYVTGNRISTTREAVLTKDDMIDIMDHDFWKSKMVPFLDHIEESGGDFSVNYYFFNLPSNSYGIEIIAVNRKDILNGTI